MHLALAASGVRQLGCALIAGVGDDALGIVVLRVLYGLDIGLNGVLCHLAERQFGACVALEQLDGIPAVMRRLAVAAHLRADLLQRVFDVLAEGDRLCRLTALCRTHGFQRGLNAVFALECADLDDRHAQCLRQCARLDGTALTAYHVHHIERDDDRQTQFHELGGQVQVALEVGRVDNVQNRVGLLGDQIVTGYNLLKRVRRKRINARQVLNDHVPVTAQLAFLFFNGDAGPVADVLTCTGQGIEQCGLATVRVARQRDFHPHS